MAKTVPFTDNLWQAAITGARIAVPPDSLEDARARAAGLVQIVQTVDQEAGVYMVQLTALQEQELQEDGDLELNNGDLWIYVELP